MTPAALVGEYRWLARLLARDFYLPGGDRQDVEQEALIALWVAARDWDPAGGRSFKSFADLVIRRRLGTRVRLAHGLKHQALNESARVGVAADDEDMPLVEQLPGGRDPVEVLIAREQLTRLAEVVRSLPALERRALAQVVNQDHGDGYDKQTDNAVTRARRKLRRAA